MTREEIVNSMSLQDAIQVFKDTNAYGTMDIAKSVILKELGKMPQWIPVSEKYPEENGRYLVTLRNGGMALGIWIGFFELWVEVTAWMPLPEPYKGGEQNV